MKSDFPHIKVTNGLIVFVSGAIVQLPREYVRPNRALHDFYKDLLNKDSENMIMGVDPLGFHFIYLNNHCTVGLVIQAKSSLTRNNVKKYPDNRFQQSYIIERIKKERKLMTFEDFIPREFVTQNIHELRNLNAKISSNVDEILNSDTEEEWEDKFDRADENIKKIFVASRLIKFILDNIKFYIPDYIKTLTVDKTRTFRVHRSVSKIVKISRNDFKRAKVDTKLTGNTNRIMSGNREYFELILMLLVENAIKYSNDASTLAPVVHLEDIDNLTRVSIKSYGVIIPTQDRTKLFSKGFRSDVHKSLGEGTGMGLHNAHELAKLFNGSLTYVCEGVSQSAGKEIGWNNFMLEFR